MSNLLPTCQAHYVFPSWARVLPDCESYHLEEPLPSWREDQKISIYRDLADSPLLNIHFTLRNAIPKINGVKDSRVKDQAQKLLAQLQLVLSAFDRTSEFDLAVLPVLEAVPVDDGSLLLEWVSLGFRLGFSLEPDAADSSWFLITPREFGGLDASGYLTEDPKLLVWLLWYILTRF
jgi:hypothetical protein